MSTIGDDEIALKRAFGFDDGELLLNRQKIVSSAQGDLLEVYSQNFRRGTVTAIVGFIVSGLFMITLPLLMGEKIKGNVMWLWILGVSGFMMLVGAVFIAFGFYRARHLRSKTLDIAEGNAYRAEKKFRHGRFTAYYVWIGAVKFQLDTRKKYESIRDEKVYRFYYVKYRPTHIVLSVEQTDM